MASFKRLGSRFVMLCVDAGERRASTLIVPIPGRHSRETSPRSRATLSSLRPFFGGRMFHLPVKGRPIALRQEREGLRGTVASQRLRTLCDGNHHQRQRLITIMIFRPAVRRVLHQRFRNQRRRLYRGKRKRMDTWRSMKGDRNASFSYHYIVHD